MSVLGFVLLAIAAWTALSVVALSFAMPLFRIAAGSPRDPEPAEQPRRAAFVSETSPPLRGSGYPGIVLERLVLHATTIFAADQVCVFGRDTRVRDDNLVLVQGAGVNPDLIGRPLDVRWDPMVAALACGRPLAVPGHLWPVWEADDDIAGASLVRSAAMAPIWFGGRLQGAIGLTHHSHGRRLDMDGLGRLGQFAELVGQALAHTVGRELSVADPQPEIDGLVAALERAVPGSGERCSDVARLARLLADERGIAGPDLIELDLAARLSGVGRLRMPPGGDPWRTASAHADRELLRLEPLWGSDMVARIPGLEAVALIVRHSRERWDGRGHPDGLGGEEIPLASRLIAVAETACSGQPVGEMAGASLDPALAERLSALVAEARPIPTG